MYSRRSTFGLVPLVWLGVVVICGAAVLHPWHRPVPYADARGTTVALLGLAPSAYPWSTESDAAASDPWGFPKRQCTSYVAWYLNSHGVPFAERTRGPSGVGIFGDAASWARATTEAGFGVSATPMPGSVAQWSGGEPSRADSPSATPVPRADGQGHVAVVLTVLADESVVVAEYDGRTRVFTQRRDRAPRYLLIGTTI